MKKEIMIISSIDNKIFIHASIKCKRTMKRKIKRILKKFIKNYSYLKGNSLY